jgi:hypothetical protein
MLLGQQADVYLTGEMTHVRTLFERALPLGDSWELGLHVQVWLKVLFSA